MQAIIHLADQRGCSEKQFFRSYHSLNFGEYFSEHRKPVGSLYALNDEALKGSSTTRHICPKDSLIFLLPIIGGVTMQVDQQDPIYMEAGEFYWTAVKRDAQVQITNPYHSEWVHYLTAWFSMDIDAEISSKKSSFDIEETLNKMVLLSSPRDQKISVGKFSGRAEGKITLEDTSHHFYAFVIEGAFEIQERLLHPRDGLAITGADTVEFEALSNNAILLTFEI